MKKLSVDWTKHLRDPEAKHNFEQLVRNTVQVLSRMKDMIDEETESLNQAEFNSKDYETPSWSHKQADRIGQRKSLNRVRQWLSFLEPKEARP